MKRPSLLLTVLIMIAARASAGDPPQAAQSFVKAGRLLDVRAGTLIANQVVVIRGDRVERVAPADQVQIPAELAQAEYRIVRIQRIGACE